MRRRWMTAAAVIATICLSNPLSQTPRDHVTHREVYVLRQSVVARGNVDVQIG